MMLAVSGWSGPWTFSVSNFQRTGCPKERLIRLPKVLQLLTTRPAGPVCRVVDDLVDFSVLGLRKIHQIMNYPAI